MITIPCDAGVRKQNFAVQCTSDGLTSAFVLPFHCILHEQGVN